MRYTKKHIIAIISGLTIALIGAILSKTYRPYIYENNINDFHLADTITSWICVPALSLFFWGISKDKFQKCFIGSFLGMLFCEFFLGLTFDLHDIIAIF